MAVDRTRDVEALALQSLAALPERHPACLVWCGHHPEQLVSDLDERSAPEVLHIFEMAEAVIRPALKSLGAVLSGHLAATIWTNG